jgi:hypothetical protein
VSPGAACHKLYNATLTQQHSFSYLGIEIDYRGINAKAQASARVEKAQQASDRLYFAGARFRNFPCHVNLQMYAAFIRPGLEYGLALLKHDKSAVWRLQQCQKKIICRFLGVNINARNDIVEGISNCPAIQVRQLFLRNRRATKLSQLWLHPDCYDFALPFVRRGLFGPDLTLDHDLDVSKSPQVLRFDWYVLPVTHSLAERSNGVLSIALLRWILRSRVGAGIFRTILLWLLQRWRIFGPPRRCLHCDGLFADQSHIASCSSLRESIVTQCPVPSSTLDLTSLTYSASNVIEHALLLACQNLIFEPQTVSNFLVFLVEVIRSSLSLIFGEAPAI